MAIRDHIFVIVGAILALVLQIVVAPHIALYGAMPNFIVVYAIALGLVRAESFGCVLPFVLGLVYDFASGGPVGPMAFSLLLFSYLAARIFVAADNDTLFMPILVMAVTLLLVEITYSSFILLLGYGAGPMQVFLYRTVPCYLYDCVMALLVFPLMARVFPPTAPIRSDLTQLR